MRKLVSIICSLLLLSFFSAALISCGAPVINYGHPEERPSADPQFDPALPPPENGDDTVSSEAKTPPVEQANTDDDISIIQAATQEELPPGMMPAGSYDSVLAGELINPPAEFTYSSTAAYADGASYLSLYNTALEQGYFTSIYYGAVVYPTADTSTQNGYALIDWWGNGGRGPFFGPEPADDVAIHDPNSGATAYAKPNSPDEDNSVACADDDEFVAGIAVRTDNNSKVVNWIGVICKKMSIESLGGQLSPPSKYKSEADFLNQVSAFGGGANGGVAFVQAPPGYVVTGIDVKLCNLNGADVIGKVRATYRGVSMWGLHTKELKGNYMGDNCGEGRPRNWQDANAGWTPLSCPGPDGILRGFVGRANAFVENIAGLCGDGWFPKKGQKPGISKVSIDPQPTRVVPNPPADNPKWDACPANEAQSGFVSAVYSFVKPNEKFPTFMVDYQPRCSTLTIGGSFTGRDPLSDEFAKQHVGYGNVDCPDGYLATGMESMQGNIDNRVNQILMVCSALDLENDLYPNPVVRGDPDFLINTAPPRNAQAASFKINCPDKQVATSLLDSRSDLAINGANYPAVAINLQGLECHGISIGRCGDRITDMASGEQCDDGNAVTEACPYGQKSCTVCTATCQNGPGIPTFCGDGMKDAMNGEACDDGNAVTETCAYGQMSCTVCDAMCKNSAGATSYCGDARTDGGNGEQCDDGNKVTEACKYGDKMCTVCNEACMNGPGIPSFCGDGKPDAMNGEDCDDGNNVTEACKYGDKMCTVCGAACKNVPGAASFCGDSKTDGGNGETCDDGNNITEACKYNEKMCTVCDAMCKSIPGATSFCGDNRVDAMFETCDDGNSVTEACQYGQKMCTVCDATCKNGPGVVSFCGDNRTDMGNGEQCDDGNNVTEACAYNQKSCTICNAMCKNQAGATSFCGDNRVDAMFETCDDGNSVTEACQYGQKMCTVCDAACKNGPGVTSFCGDGRTDGGNGEQCDDANMDETDSCINTCKTARCGDGKVFKVGCGLRCEECDDGAGNGPPPARCDGSCFFN